jgi:hypothetical protein
VSALQWLAALYGLIGAGTVSVWVMTNIRTARTCSPPLTWRRIGAGLTNWRFLATAAFALLLWPWFLPLWVADEKGWIR